MTTDRQLKPVPAASLDPILPVATDRADSTRDDPEVAWKDLPPNPFQHSEGKPDQKPLDWRPLLTPHAPSNPFTTRSCVVPVKAPADPNPQQPRFRGPHPDNNRRQPGATYEGMGDPNQVARDRYWSEFRNATIQAHGTHESIGSQVSAFDHPERDKELRALMFINPSDNFHGELDDYVNTQQIPTRGGLTVGSLFDDKNQLVLSNQDRASIDALGRDTDKGKNGAKVEKADYSAIEADNQFERAFFALKEAVLASQAAAEGLTKAKAKFEEEVASEAARGEQTEIDRLKQDAAEVVEIVEGITSYVTMVAQFATGNVGDGIEQVGMLAAKLLSHINDGKIAAAEQRLEKALDKKWASRKLATVAGLDQARHTFQASQNGVTSKEAGVRAGLTARRRAYNTLGTTAGSQIKGPKSTGERVAGILSAIPIAEFVAARAAAIASSSESPLYSEAAGRGFMMARQAGRMEAPWFIETVSELAFCKMYYGSLERQWDRRVVQLHEIRRKIVGSRPGDDG